MDPPLPTSISPSSSHTTTHLSPLSAQSHSNETSPKDFLQIRNASNSTNQEISHSRQSSEASFESASETSSLVHLSHSDLTDTEKNDEQHETDHPPTILPLTTISKNDKTNTSKNDSNPRLSLLPNPRNTTPIPEVPTEIDTRTIEERIRLPYFPLSRIEQNERIERAPESLSSALRDWCATLSTLIGLTSFATLVNRERHVETQPSESVRDDHFSSSDVTECNDRRVVSRASVLRVRISTRIASCRKSFVSMFELMKEMIAAYVGVWKPAYPLVLAASCGVLIGILLNDYYRRSLNLRRMRNLENYLSETLRHQKINNELIIRHLDIFRNETLELFKNILMQQSRIKLSNRPFSTMLIEY